MSGGKTQSCAGDIGAELQGFRALSAAPKKKIENEALSQAVYGFTVPEVAKRLGISVEAAQSLIRAGLESTVSK